MTMSTDAALIAICLSVPLLAVLFNLTTAARASRPMFAGCSLMVFLTASAGMLSGGLVAVNRPLCMVEMHFGEENQDVQIFFEFGV
jgi:hypothetical protein